MRDSLQWVSRGVLLAVVIVFLSACSPAPAARSAPIASTEAPTGAPAASATPIAPTVTVAAATSTSVPSVEPATPEPTLSDIATATSVAAPASPPSATVVSATPTSEPTQVPTAPQVTVSTAPTPTSSAPIATSVSVFQIDPSQSQASFTLNEDLLGSPTVVQGLTSDVSGVISVTEGELNRTTIGAIQINARSLSTDDEFRNRSLRTLILQSDQDQYQYITFEPATVKGLPASVKPGDTVTFTVTGNLKIRDVRKPVAFDISVTRKSETELDGDAKATVKRTDFDLNIPNVPGVANVSDEVVLEFQFVAKHS